jgi:hypothetical protein
VTPMADAIAPAALSAGLAGLGKLMTAIQAPDGAIVTAENIAAQIDPALAPEIMAAQVILPLLAAVLEILGTQSGVAAASPVGGDPQFSRGR